MSHLESNIEEKAEMVIITPPISDVPMQHTNISRHHNTMVT